MLGGGRIWASGECFIAQHYSDSLCTSCGGRIWASWECFFAQHYSDSLCTSWLALRQTKVRAYAAHGDDSSATCSSLLSCRSLLCSRLEPPSASVHSGSSSQQRSQNRFLWTAAACESMLGAPLDRPSVLVADRPASECCGVCAALRGQRRSENARGACS